MAIAVLGAVLGVINTCHQLSKDRVRLRVTPTWVMVAVGGHLSDKQLGIEIVNLSGFPVTVCDAGFLRGRFKGKRVVITHPVLLDGGAWPRRLAPHDTITILAEALQSEPEMLMARRAYARTTSGIVRYGSSGALRQFTQEVRATL